MPAQRLSFWRLVRPEPSPVNAVATMTPSTLTFSPFAVVPIPTPSPSIQKTVEPDPTLNEHSPGSSVATPTLSKTTLVVPVSIPTEPNGNQAFSEV